jgi:hypothetical protein
MFGILELIIAVLKAPAEIRALILLLSKTPEEKKIEISIKVAEIIKLSQESERPNWDESTGS